MIESSGIPLSARFALAGITITTSGVSTTLVAWCGESLHHETLAGRDSGLILFLCAAVVITDGGGVVRLGITSRPYNYCGRTCGARVTVVGNRVTGPPVVCKVGLSCRFPSLE